MGDRTTLVRDTPSIKAGITTHDDSDEVIVHSVQDVTGIMEHAARMRDTPKQFAAPLRPVAEIPLVIYNRLRRLGIAGDPVAMRKWLNNPDNRAFRTSVGRV